MMAARWRRDLEPEVDPADAEREFTALARLLRASEPGGRAAALSAQVQADAAAIASRGGSPAEQLAELWQAIDELGLHAAAERHVASLADARRRWASPPARGGG